MAQVAFLLGAQFEDSEMQQPYEAIRKAGHDTVIIGLKAGVKWRASRSRSPM
ncbi:protease I [Paenibacillus sp. 1_12]|nr:protease I [Paenibacillus sp. 1_12]